LTARGFLCTFSDNSHWLVGVQVLDGVGAGVFGALFPIVVQDLTHGTGRFNVSLGAVNDGMGSRRGPVEHRRRVDCGGRWLPRGVHLAGRAGRGGVDALLGRHARNRAECRETCRRRGDGASPEWGREGLGQAASKCYRRVASILRVRVPAKVTNTTLCPKIHRSRVSDLAF
jgi:hypothetical protein